MSAVWQAAIVMCLGLVVFFVGAVSNTYRRQGPYSMRTGVRVVMVVLGFAMFAAGVGLLCQAFLLRWPV